MVFMSGCYEFTYECVGKGYVDDYTVRKIACAFQLFLTLNYPYNQLQTECLHSFGEAQIEIL